MAALAGSMPPIEIDIAELKRWGAIWLGTEPSGRPPGSKVQAPQRPKQPNRFDRKQGMDFGYVFDAAFGKALASMLGGIDVLPPKTERGQTLLPPHPDCVEVGPTRIVGGIRPQNFDAAYRPDGPRVVYDSKTLNDAGSIPKNWQNMINDLATEASTVHTRFPYCLVCFLVVVPRPALGAPQERALIRTLERLGSRTDELDQAHLAEAISLVIWDPNTGEIDRTSPPPGSNLCLSTMHTRIYPTYLDRYKNLPPHEAEEETEAAEIDVPGNV